jgi:hypothetical protein
VWTTSQRYYTAVALSVLFGFVVVALCVDRSGFAGLNPFSSEDCARYVDQRALSKQQQSQHQFSGGEGREISAEGNTRNPSADAPEQQSSQSDYYACRLAAYTNKLAWFTGALVVATIALFGIGNLSGSTMSWTPKMRQLAKVEPCP